jgi:hypothetical protein
MIPLDNQMLLREKSLPMIKANPLRTLLKVKDSDWYTQAWTRSNLPSSSFSLTLSLARIQNNLNSP